MQRTLIKTAAADLDSVGPKHPPGGEGAGMLEIRIQGRGGQGVRVGGQILAEAFFRGGASVHLTTDDSARRGAAVTASLRVAADPIHLRGDVERPDYALVLDASLLDGLDAASVAERLVVVNAPAGPCARMPGADRVVAIDATGIAGQAGLGSIVAPAVIGAFAAVTGLVSLADLQAAVEDRIPVQAMENMAACTIAYLELASPMGLEAGLAGGWAR